MSDRRGPAERFERHRAHLRAVARRMLGPHGDADDALQEAWLRVSRADAADVEDHRAWLTTVVARVCLDMLRARKGRREEPLDEAPDALERADDVDRVEREALLAASVGPALLVVLEALAPAERVAFVLHDVFGLSFEEIAPIVERSPVAARKLASRARTRVQGATAAPDPAGARQRALVDAFVAAARTGDVAGLVAVLSPDVVVRADAQAARFGAAPEVRGAEAAAQSFARRSRGAQRAIVDGAPGVTWAPNGKPRVVFRFTFDGDAISAIDLVGDAGTLARLDVVVLEA
ncbi:MAG TPA: sigma-70 family RNA polymerase sigma factor [Byssovorax sp.]|jgi:RNA polymerase sigma-70 factor (ECF subfamily)